MAIFAGFHVACAILFLLPWHPLSGRLNLEWWLACLVASTWLLAGGLWDDRRSLPPLVKLAWQAAAGIIFILFSGNTIGGFDGCLFPPWADWSLTLLFFLLFINAFNLIDGIDGLATGLALLSGLAFAAILFVQRQPTDVLVLLALAGPCAAFLRYNFNPARIFLGDSGSMFLGFVLAAVAVGTTQSASGLLTVLVPLLVVGVPVLDVLLAVWRRSVRGFAYLQNDPPPAASGVMTGDREHLHHRFLDRGLSQRQVAVMLYGVNLALCLLALALLVFHGLQTVLMTVAAVVAVILVARHVAHLEMWDSGLAMVKGVRRPSNRALPMILYPVLDTLVLALALLASLWLREWLVTGRIPVQWPLPRETFTMLVPVAVGIPFLAMVIFGAYARVWSRARLWDFCALAGALAGSCLVVEVVLSLAMPTAVMAAWCLPVLQTIIAAPFLLGIRGWSHLFRDLLCLSRPSQRFAGGKPDHVLLVGAGWRCQLFLRERQTLECMLSERHRIAGILDDDINLRGRLVYGHRVVGTLEELPKRLGQPPVKTIVILCDLPEERCRLLAAMARQYGLRLTEWRIEQGPPAWAAYDGKTS